MRRLILIYSNNLVLEMALTRWGSWATPMIRGTTTFRILPILIWLTRCQVRLCSGSFWHALWSRVYEGKMEDVMSEWKADMVRCLSLKMWWLRLGVCYAS